MDLVFATQNENKLKEIKLVLSSHFNIISLKDIGCSEELAETGKTFEANALQKARYIFKEYKRNCFADDSGIEITDLGGKPGINSARFAGENKSSDANIDKVLKLMIHARSSTARFRTVIALILNGKEFIFEGVIKGKIIKERKGENGFGYDPIFIPDGYSKTFAEMKAQEKNKISHRGIAVDKLAEFLINNYNPAK